MRLAPELPVKVLQELGDFFAKPTNLDGEGRPQQGGLAEEELRSLLSIPSSSQPGSRDNLPEEDFQEVVEYYSKLVRQGAKVDKMSNPLLEIAPNMPVKQLQTLTDFFAKPQNLDQAGHPRDQVAFRNLLPSDLSQDDATKVEQYYADHKAKINLAKMNKKRYLCSL